MIRLFIYSILLCVPLLSQAQSYPDVIKAHRLKAAAEFAGQENGPIRKDQVQYLQYFDADQHYQVQAEVEQLFNEPSFRMPTYDGTSNEYKKFALLHFKLKGKPYTLTAYQSVALFQNPAYQNHLFVPFMDQTNGESSYEGGRYMDLNRQDIKDGKITLDFNYDYNPYCAYSNGYRCPQPPLENHLDIAIEAGEKKYLGPKNERPVNKKAAKNFNETEQKIINSGDENSLMHVYQTTSEPEIAVLRKPSEDIKHDEPLLDKLAARMLKTVNDPEHQGVGIAGPQVGINKNVIWVQRLDKDGTPFEFYINPKILWRSKLMRQGPEGCLSIPDLRQDVQRSYAIRLQYIDRKTGEVKEELLEGFTAVIFQHEVDHLYGILFPDRIEEQNKKEMLPVGEKLKFYTEKGAIIP